jgi:hypothetical protein
VADKPIAKVMAAQRAGPRTKSLETQMAAEEGNLTSTPKRRELALFGPPPLIEGEDPVAYDELLARVASAVSPSDIIEEILVRDFVDLDWEVSRLRRLKASLMSATAYTGVQAVLRPLGAGEALAEEWAAREPRAIKRVDRMLSSAGLTMNSVMAQTLCNHLEAIKCIEDMTAAAEARRNDALCEIERHRAMLAHALRRAVRQVEDTEYQVIDAGADEPKSAA